MHTAQVGFIRGRNVVSTIARNTSCNSGWLRLVVQIIFGTLIVSSFILILLMVVGKPGRNAISTSRCSVTNCRVICNNAPYYGDFEEDIINAASEANAQPQCETIHLKLMNPTFKNFEVPPSWLWSMTCNVRELAIVGGNVKHIAPDAFMSPFGGNIEDLILEEIELNIWESDMLVGLSNLQKLLIRDCILADIRKGALAPIDDSLIFLDIKSSNHWSPINVTGSTRLSTLKVVDFSLNSFYNNLNNASFFKLRACKTLFLNSCQIISLAHGTFDYLENIEDLYLNDNLLVTIPVGLFDRILPREPNFALQDNLWHCDCSRGDMRNIVRKELLLVDPICNSPASVTGMTFSDFEGYCKLKDDDGILNSGQGILKTNSLENNTSTVIYMNGACHGNMTSNTSHQTDSLRVIAFSEHPNCLLNRINEKDIEKIYESYKADNRIVSKSSSWIKPVFFVQNNPYSMIEITSSALPGYGLLWYQSPCDGIIYCVSTMPHILKVFNVDIGHNFTFCPFNLSSGIVKSSHCLSYNITHVETVGHYRVSFHEIMWFICLSTGCLLFGAICVYGMIHRNPALLRGSKRVLFVKHKSVDALILPPKLPLRKSNTELMLSKCNVNEENKIFVLPNKLNTITCENFARSVSMKSNESTDASYISALQPTEEQLTEWRCNQIVRQFENTAPDLSMVPYRSMYERDLLPYYYLNKEERVYEVPKHC